MLYFISYKTGLGFFLITPKINTDVIYRQMENDRDPALIKLHLFYLYIVRKHESPGEHIIAFKLFRVWGGEKNYCSSVKLKRAVNSWDSEVCICFQCAENRERIQTRGNLNS